jgi:hypothetical protein
MKWQGVLTVVFTAVVYSIAFLPNTVYHIGEPFVGVESLKSEPFRVTFFRVAASVLTVNVIANFFIYCLTVNSFRAFLRVRIQWIVSYSFSSSDGTANLTQFPDQD